jgi:hypothetical protein
MAVLAPLLLSAAPAQPEPPGDRVGDRYELIRSYETSSESSKGSSGSSQGHTALVERVIGIRPDGLELEYDLPESVPAEDRASDWQFPVRIFWPNGGQPQLLNRAELEARVDGWLKKGKMTRAACGRWIFTWNAFKIECDPQSAIGIVQAYDLRSPDLREGALHREKEALAPAPLTRRSEGPNGSIFAARMEIDPVLIRRGRAETDVVVAEISGKPVTLEAATEARAKDGISGTISVTFVTDPAGRAIRRTKVVKLETRKADGSTETETLGETVERQRVFRR